MIETLFALVSGREGHFALESGHHGGLWLDLDGLFAQPSRVAPLVDALSDAMRKHDVDVLCGPLVGGAFLAQAMATALDKQFAYTERVASEASGLYATRYRLPSTFVPRVRNARVAIVDDVMSAGSSARATFDELQSHGASVVAVGALLILGDAGAAWFAERGVASEALARRPYELWLPESCPLCEQHIELVRP